MSTFKTNYIDSSKNTKVDTVGTDIYVGYSDLGSSPSEDVWCIKKVSTSPSISITHAEGNAYFDKIWDNRTSYSYS